MKPKQKMSVLPLALANGKLVMLTALLLGVFVASIQAVDQKSVKPSAASPSPSSASLGSRDAIYIDDDSIEGSGGRGGIHEDLEKDPDYSGSGFGPDDEDAEPDHHSHGSHNTRISQSGGASINTAHTPTQTSSTTSATTTSSSTAAPTTTTTSTSISSNATWPATTPASTTTTTTTTQSSVQLPESNMTTQSNTPPSNPNLHPIMPPFDSDLDMEEGSGDNDNDDDDNDNDDDDGDDDDQVIDGADDDEDDDDIIKPVFVPEEHEINHADPDDGLDKDIIDLDDNNSGVEIDTDIDGGTDGKSNTERGPGAGGSNVHALDPNTNVNSQPSDTKSNDHRPNGNEVVIMSEDDRTSSFFSQPGILAAVIGGAVVGLLCAILVVMFIVYRMRKKDEGSYALDEPKRSPANNSYAKNANNREFYA